MLAHWPNLPLPRVGQKCFMATRIAQDLCWDLSWPEWGLGLQPKADRIGRKERKKERRKEIYLFIYLGRLGIKRKEQC